MGYKKGKNIYLITKSHNTYNLYLQKVLKTMLL